MGRNITEYSWVVGGTSGIGKACYELIKDELEFIALASGTEVDVRSQDQVSNWVSDHEDSYHRITSVIYSAGVNELEWIDNLDPSVMINLYDVNVVGLLRVIKSCQWLRRVVVIGSDAAWRPMRASAAYCASKAALHHFVSCVTREKASPGFAINIVAPGMTADTGMSDKVDRQVLAVRGWDADYSGQYEQSQIPVGRRATPAEVAEVAVNVLMTQTPYMNGAVIAVNGGRY